VYRVFVSVSGRLFGWIPFSVAEILVILLITGGVGWIVFMIVQTIRKKGERRKTFARLGLPMLCVASTIWLNFVLACGINYNRHTFIHESDVSFARTDADELRVFMALLDEFNGVFYDLESQIKTDENGVFKLTRDLSVTAPAAMRNLAETEPRLDVYFPRPKPIRFLSGFMSDAFIIGVFFPLTIEANYNSLAPDSERAMAAIHELVHVAGFMREDEANFLSLTAGRNSDDLELVYASYVYAFESILRHWRREFARDHRIHSIANKEALLPQQVRRDIRAQRDFWWSRRFELKYDDEGEVVGVIENPVAEAISSASSGINDAFLRAQGQDGIVTYGRMVDLFFATELERLDSESDDDNE
jgi:hypothetical protein